MNKEQKTSQTTEPAIAVEPMLPTVFDYPFMANRFIQSVMDTGWILTSEEQNKLSNIYQLSLMTELGS